MKPNMMSVVSAFLFFHLLSIATFDIGFCNGRSTYVGGCIESERQALLTFKQDLNDSSNRLASWIDDGDCCNWAGIVCDNFTGHVLQLRLGNPHLEFFTSDDLSDYSSEAEYEAEYEAYSRSQLVGKINPSLLDLKLLIHLDLSLNDFEGIQIPGFLGSMHNLRYLNLSEAGFHGMIPQQLGNLSNLQYLDLSLNDFEGIQIPGFLGSMHNLRYLNLSHAGFHGMIPQQLGNLSNLQYLDLSFNDFEGIQIPGFLGSMHNLRYLHLSHAGFHGMIPQQLGNLSNLQYLDLQSSQLGFEPYVENLKWISGLSLLKHLDLSGINLNKSADWLLKINSLPFLQVLQLSSCQLQHFPKIPVVNFSSLTTLDLSRNNFDNYFIPSWVYGLRDLVFLDLSSNKFQGPILDGLGNLTSLKHLDLSSNSCNSSIPNLLSRLSRLEFLSLLSNDLQGSIPSSLGNLTSMETLDFSGNMLEGNIPKSFGRLCNLTSFSMSDGNFNSNISEILDIFSACVSAKLESLDLSYGNFSGNLTFQLGLFKNLKALRLSSNSISGPIPSSIGELSSLITLDLSENTLSGNIPSSLGELSSLRDLTLSYNKLNGPIPSSLGKLSALEILSLAYNKLNGTLSQVHFANLTRLTDFFASENSLTLKVSSDWVPPFQLYSLYLGSCHMGPQFPSWLHSQKSLSDLDISSAQISDVIPDWFWKSISQFTQLNLSNNQIHGEIPNLTGTREIVTLDLSSNNLSGSLPLLSIDVNSLDLSSNVLSGSISRFLCDGMNKSRNTEILDLKNNLFSGELPDCWLNWQKLLVLNLENNEFTGRLPTSMGNLGALQALILRKNSLSGVIPYESFKNCTNLEAIDAAENKFVGNVPRWIGERFPSMKILNFRSNKLHGLLPMELCQLSSLQILNLAYNHLSGNIPSCISNFSAMVTVNHSLDTDIAYLATAVDYYLDELLLKGGTEYGFETTLNLVRAIDLSKNNFSGEIPRELTSLVELKWLNLSHNSLSGRIPENIGAMREIESIDFSSNQLSGEIPWSISNLSFLSYLNLADNNLTGKIPTGGTQIQGFNESFFTGNDLCGSPLPDCIVTVDTPEHENGGGNDGNELEVDWFYVSMALGFAVGFCGFISPLLMNRKWRYMYYNFLDRLWDKIYFIARKCC